MMEQYLQNRVMDKWDKFGHPDLLEFITKTHPEVFKVEDEVEWQDLFIATSRYASHEAARQFAEVQAQRVRQKEDFVKLAEQCDDGDGKLRKSVGIGRKRGEIKPAECEATLFRLKEGDTAVVENENGFHVVHVVKRQVAGQLPFDEKTQKMIKDKLRNELFQIETKRIVMELKRRAIIEVYK